MPDFMEDFEILKAREAPDNLFPVLGEEFTVERKWDGHRLLLIRHLDGRFEARTRTRGIDLIEQIRENADVRKAIRHMPPGTVLDGELWASGVPATSVKTLIIKQAPNLHFSPFAIPFWSGDDRREETCLYARRMIEHMGFDASTCVTRFRMDREWLVERAIKYNYEGWVIKDRNYSGWWKLKPKRTVDCVVMDTTVSTSITKYGSLKAIKVGLYDDWGHLREVASVGSGFEDEFRDQHSSEGKRRLLLRRVCEIEFDAVAARGKLKFPRFVRWRDDKVPQECTMQQIEPGRSRFEEAKYEQK